MRYPRLLLSGASSGSGKTLITCGILQALCDRGLQVASFKCGPDYIDPMFHSRVIGTKSRNLDTFFTGEEMTRYLFARAAKSADLSVIEGVMGYYDGLGGVSVEASTYDVARVTDTPVVLIVNCRGMSMSALALIRGFMEFRPDSHIRGVILNQMPEMLYPEIKKWILQELGIICYGYVPVIRGWLLESRHLGLVKPDEIPDLKRNLKDLSKMLEKTLDIDGLLKLAMEATELEAEKPEALKDLETEKPEALKDLETEKPEALKDMETEKPEVLKNLKVLGKLGEGNKEIAENHYHPVIAVARDEAFCFLYEDNLELFKECGAKLFFFSPLHDERLPEADGFLLSGGYPELYVKELSENRMMLDSLREVITSGMPGLAECGGFMYLQQEMEDMDGNSYPMVGVLPGRAYKTSKLGRFGYIFLKPNRDQLLGADIGVIKGHEFHYFDSTDCGDAFRASKPLSHREWNCMQTTGNVLAGYPHLYYYSNPLAAKRFVEKCAEYAKRMGKRKSV